MTHKSVRRSASLAAAAALLSSAFAGAAVAQQAPIGLSQSGLAATAAQAPVTATSPGGIANNGSQVPVSPRSEPPQNNLVMPYSVQGNGRTPVLANGATNAAVGTAQGEASVAQGGQQVFPLPPPPPNLPGPNDFREALIRTMPLNGSQVTETRERWNDVQKAFAGPPGKPVKATTGSVVVKLDPGDRPPVVRLAPGHSTALHFVDSTGAAWPIITLSNGSPQQFDVKVPVQGGSTVTIVPMSSYGSANVQVFLQDLSAPVSVGLLTDTGAAVSEYRKDIRILARGPNAATPIVSTDTVPENGSHEIISILDGIPPDGSRKLKVSGSLAEDQTEAWQVGGTMYVRTRLHVLSPQSKGRVSASGVNVYALPPSALIVVSRNGQTSTISIDSLR